jgi:hypothetical protein
MGNRHSLLTINNFRSFLLTALCLLPTCLRAQQPQAQAGQPIYPINAKYVQGFGPGYWPTAGAQLTLNLAPGTAICSNTVQTYMGGTLTLAAGTTNYVYLDAANNCTPTSNTTGFSSTSIPIAEVSTGATAITAITDVRTMFVANASASVASVGMTGDGVIFNTTVQGSPITTSGTLLPQLLTQTANSILAGPSSGSAATPTFRALVGADLPTPSANALGGVKSVTCGGGQFVDQISTSGSAACATPSGGGGGSPTGLGNGTTVIDATTESGADFSVKVNACLALIEATGGGTCDARGFSGSTQAMSENITVGDGTHVTYLYWPVNATINRASGVQLFYNSYGHIVGGGSGQSATNASGGIWSDSADAVPIVAPAPGVTVEYASVSDLNVYGYSTIPTGSAGLEIGSSAYSTAWSVFSNIYTSYTDIGILMTAPAGGCTCYNKLYNRDAFNYGGHYAAKTAPASGGSVNQNQWYSPVLHNAPVDLYDAGAGNTYFGRDMEAWSTYGWEFAGSGDRIIGGWDESGPPYSQGPSQFDPGATSNTVMLESYGGAPPNDNSGNNTNLVFGPGLVPAWLSIGQGLSIGAINNYPLLSYTVGEWSGYLGSSYFFDLSFSSAAAYTLGIYGHSGSQRGGEFDARSGLDVSGLTTTTPIANPSSPTATLSSGSGSTSYQYGVVGHDRGNRGGGGGVTLPAYSNTITSAPSSLNSTSDISVCWTAVDGIYYWDILKIVNGGSTTALTAQAPHTSTLGATTLCFTDSGQTFSAYTVPTRNTTGDASFGGKLITVNNTLDDGSGKASFTGNVTSGTGFCIGANCVTSLTQGTVTSVGLAMPAIFSVSGSPVTSSGTLTASWVAQNANLVFAGPSSGSAAAPTFRTLVGADLPAPTATTLGGVESTASTSHQWVSYIDTSGVPHQSQPSCSDLSNASAMCSTAAYSSLTGTPTLPSSITNPGHNFLTTYNASSGAFGQAQPSCSDLSNASAMCSSAAYSSLTGTPTLPSSITNPGHNFLTTYNASSGAFGQAQPSCSDLSNASAMCSSAAYSSLTGTPTLPSTITNPGHNFLTTYTASSGAFGQAQPAFTDISGSISTSQVPTLNQSTTGNAATATALAATPSQCSSGQYATGIAASGAANCGTPAGAGANTALSNLASPTAVNLSTLTFAGAAGITAGGTNQNVTLTPSTDGEGDWGVVSIGNANVLVAGATVYPLYAGDSTVQVIGGINVVGTGYNSGDANVEYWTASGNGKFNTFVDDGPFAATLTGDNTPTWGLYDNLYSTLPFALEMNSPTKSVVIKPGGVYVSGCKVGAWSCLSGVPSTFTPPAPTASTLGGIESLTCSANTWLSQISTAGVPSCSQPGFSNLTGSIAIGQTPLTTTGDLLYASSSSALTRLGIGSTNQFLGISSGVPAWVQPSFSNLSGTLSSSQLPALSAINPQSSTYQVVAADFSNYKSIVVSGGTFTITLVASTSQPPAGEYIDVINYGSGVVTIARSGQNINGGTSSLTLPASSATAPSYALVESDGTNYFASIQPSAPSIVSSFSGDGNIITNSSSTGAVTASISGTSGGVPYFSSSSAWKSSAALTQYGVLYGGGAGAAPGAVAACGANFPIVGVASGAPVCSTITHPSSLTQGGLLYASTSTAIAGGSALTQYGVVIAGAAGSSPVSTAAGGANFPLIGVASSNPTWSTIAYPTSLTSGGFLYASSTTAIAGSSLITTNVLPKSSGAGTAPAASSITDNGTDVTTSEPVLAGNSVALTSATGITGTTMATTGLVLPTIPVSKTVRGHCTLIWEQATAVSTVTFGMGMNNAPTDLWVIANTQSTTTSVTYTTITGTTTTAVTSTLTPSATSTGYVTNLDFVLETGSSNPVTLTIYGDTQSSSDELYVEPGSSCGWLP